MGLYQIVVQLPLLLLAIIVHEYAHGWVAEKFGDDTARIMGRLTFNPLVHIDPIGTIFLPLLGLLFGGPIFGWARPVPVNPYRLNNPRRDIIYVSLAGPLANLLLAIICAFGLYFLRDFLLSAWGEAIRYLLSLLLVINVVLAVFNLLPVPPLDGWKILTGLLPPELNLDFLEPYGLFILLFLVASGIVGRLISVVASFIISHLTVSGPRFL